MSLERELWRLLTGPRVSPDGAPRRARKSEPIDTDWARSLPARVARQAIQRVGLDAILAAELDVSITGVEILERVAAPAIFVANHSSHLDTPLVLGALPERWRDRTAVAAAGDYFFADPLVGAATALAFNAYPVGRSGPRDGAPGLSGRLLAEGWSVLVFPEASRSDDGTLGKLRPGVARLGIDTAVPILPIALRGTYAAMPRGRSWPSSGRPPVSVRFGDPLRARSGEAAASFARRIRVALVSLLEEDEATWWSVQRRPPDAAGEDSPEPARWRRVWNSTAARSSRAG